MGFSAWPMSLGRSFGLDRRGGFQTRPYIPSPESFRAAPPGPRPPGSRFRAGDQHRRGHLNVQGPELPVAGEIGHGFTLPAPDHQGLEAGQFVGIEGLIVAEIEVQAADRPGCGPGELRRRPGLPGPLWHGNSRWSSGGFPGWSRRLGGRTFTPGPGPGSGSKRSSHGGVPPDPRPACPPSYRPVKRRSGGR